MLKEIQGKERTEKEREGWEIEKERHCTIILKTKKCMNIYILNGYAMRITYFFLDTKTPFGKLSVNLSHVKCSTYKIWKLKKILS